MTNENEKVTKHENEPSTTENSDSAGPSPDPSPSQPKVPYSIYTRREKYFLATLVGFAGLFSPLAANTYFPAIPTLASDFGVSTELINLTVTVYMVLQGVSPMFFGTLGDQFGRKPAYVVCLIILSASCVGLALVPTSKYWLLVFLRCVQAAGSASTVALGAGVIGDISTPEDRGGLFGIYNVPIFFAPSFAPVIGGALLASLGWRSIFWFLCIASAVSAIIIILFLPETLRALVGNGSITPSVFYRAVIPVVGRHKPPGQSTERLPPKKFANPFVLFANLDVDLLLVAIGISIAVYYGITASLATLFTEIYPFLSQLELGLCYLSMGGGSAVASLGAGKVMDREMQGFKRRYAARLREDGEKQVEEGEDVAKRDDFPLEQARLRWLPLLTVINAACTIGFGWALERRVNLAVPLVLLFIIGAIGICFFNICMTALIDLAPHLSASISACSNIVRGLLSAALIATIDFAFRGIGVGWTYVALGAAVLLDVPLVWVVMKIGRSWRVRRRKAKESREGTN